MKRKILALVLSMTMAAAMLVLEIAGIALIAAGLFIS